MTRCRFRRGSSQRMHALIPSDVIAYGELDPLHRRSIIQIGASADGEHDLRVAEEAVTRRRLTCSSGCSAPAIPYAGIE